MDPQPRGGASTRLTADHDPGRSHFRLLFAMAALFHLAGNPATGFGDRSDWLVAVQAVVGVAALMVIARPRRQYPLILLCVMVPVSAWLEAPVVGNHWVLAAAVGLAYLSAAAFSYGRGDGRSTWRVFLPVGRLVLITAYGFAAFSKLNRGFLDPATSCAVYYQDQLVSSLGLSVLSVTGRSELGLAVAVGAVAVELSVPLLLSFHRTRGWGVLLGMSFHWMLALDLWQHFWDFTAILFACFVLFLGPDRHDAIRGYLRSARLSVRPAVRSLLVGAGVLVALPVIAAASLGAPAELVVVAVLIGHAAWWLFGTAALLCVACAIARVQESRQPGPLRLASPVLLVVPVIVVLNGMTPYLEIKTGFGWNMYSNLRTVAGETNHLLVPRTWDSRSAQVDRVAVLASTDPRLLAREDVEFVWSEFREYARDNAQESVTYTRGGTVFRAATLAEDPATAEPVGVLERRLLSFRAVDVSGSERCLDTFGPAR